MPAGTIQKTVVCSASSPAVGAVELRNGGAATVIYCDAGRTMRQWRMDAYVIDPAAASYIDAVASPYDYAGGAALFFFAFTTVLGTWYFSRNVGLIMEAIKKF